MERYDTQRVTAAVPDDRTDLGRLLRTAFVTSVVCGYQVLSYLISARTFARSVLEARYVVRMNGRLAEYRGDLKITTPALWVARYDPLRN